MKVAEWGARAGRGIAQRDGNALAHLFSLHASGTRRCAATIVEPSVSIVQALLHGASLPPPWGDICAHYLCAGAFLFGPKTASRAPVESWRRACEEMHAAVSTYLRFFTSLTPGRWVLPVTAALLQDLRWVSQGSDDAGNVATSAAAAAAHGETPLPTHRHLEECARQLNKAFSACIADRNPVLTESKKWGTYAMVGMVFRTYFQLKSVSLCRNILRALAAADLPPLDAFPRADMVTYWYYVGRLAFLDEDYERANTELARAYANAPRDAQRQCERILLYWLPVRLLQGVRPSPALLAAYPRLDTLFAPFVNAYRTGDVRAYDAALEDPAAERALVRLGVFLALERAREGCVARLFRRVWLVSGKSTRLRLDRFWAALCWRGEGIDREDAEWSLATLIAKGRMRGYIAHERQVLVLSAADPFPHPTLAMLR
ncbi:COP9 signalosome (CSN) subunit [Malassezia sp. CBS 17886]|nr:COP9 signalosome (CSN) subunit [Malassezia sp. CBS 17886]